MMRGQVMSRVAEDLRRFRVVKGYPGYYILDVKLRDNARDKKGTRRFFRNKGRAQKVADRLEAEANNETTITRIS